MSNQSFFSDALTAGDGIVRLAPCWVPRAFLMPGGRLKLDSRDLYAFGAHRGGIDERWFSSTTKAANGPLTTPDEGLSYIEFNGKKALLKEAIETARGVGLGLLTADPLDGLGQVANSQGSKLALSLFVRGPYDPARPRCRCFSASPARYRRRARWAADCRST